MPDSFEEKLAFGEEAEHLVAAYLIRRGSAVSPLYPLKSKNGRGPRLLFANGDGACDAVLPDMTAWDAHGGFFVEVKRKQHWVNYIPAKRGLETGFNQKVLPDYAAVREKTGLPLYVFFVHERQEPHGVYVAELGELLSVRRDWSGRDGAGRRVGKPEVLFPITALRRLCGLVELGLHIATVMPVPIAEVYTP